MEGNFKNTQENATCEAVFLRKGKHYCLIRKPEEKRIELRQIPKKEFDVMRKNFRKTNKTLNEILFG